MDIDTIAEFRPAPDCPHLSPLLSLLLSPCPPLLSPDCPSLLPLLLSPDCPSLLSLDCLRLPPLLSLPPPLPPLPHRLITPR